MWRRIAAGFLLAALAAAGCNSAGGPAGKPARVYANGQWYGEGPGGPR
jgi:hypothetical protein